MNNRILPVFALMIAVGIFFMYINPKWSDSIAATKAAIASDDQALAAAKEYDAQQNKLASERSKINQADLARLTTFLPDSVDNVGLILDLNALAARNGLSLSNIDITTDAKSSKSSGATTPGTSSTASAGPLTSAELSLSAVGTYTSLQNFLHGVEKSQRLLDVRDIVVKGSETGVYSYEMKIRLYWLH
ncbi:MAG: type 4a pilus biogenesis protein PilO [Candidatus Kaiserbacteria bacterium]|nr:type 4a pilus biogenesis protein PilO [Candidatus Kaiserbacteria bacterium]